MCSAPVGTTQPQAPSSTPPPRESCCAAPRFSKLRGVRWRVDLGILPSSASSSIEDLRRVAADSRRRYASLRRHLLVDPHLSKDGSKSPDLVMDNPLSQNPDSMWGRFFRNAELEKMVDQDLSRLYPEHGSYFQTPTCQAMLRRILLLWCLKHPEYGYRQGMHELLAPLLYVLHVDVQCLCQVRKLHEDHFNDEFDETFFPESDVVSNYRFTKNINGDGESDRENCFQGDVAKSSSSDELDPDTRDVILVGDAYGAEGELGILPSKRFMEHDAYCMFDALMNGSQGVVAMAEFFSPSPAIGSSTGLPPVIEASSALYHLLSVVDSSVHYHLVELGIEPQYFALRWLRVLYGREFSLDNLLVIWDEIFLYPNSRCLLGTENEAQFKFRILCSPRGAFISGMAVSMILHIRSSLLATENATSCLQRLLNLTGKINLNKLIDKAKSLQAVALDANIFTSQSETVSERNKSTLVRGYSLSSGSVSPKTPLFPLPESYWEEKWRVLHRAEELQRGSQSGSISKGTLKKSLDREIFSLPRTESDPTPAKIVSGKKDGRSSVRRRLLDDLSQGVDSDLGKSGCKGISDLSGIIAPLSAEGLIEKDSPGDSTGQNTMAKNLDCMIEETCLSEENSSVFSTEASPLSITHDQENDSEKSSVSSSSCVGDNDGEINPVEQSRRNGSSNLVLGDTKTTTAASVMLVPDTDVTEKQAPLVTDRRQSHGRFQWFWKFGRGAAEGDLEKGNVEPQKSMNVGNKEISGSPSSVACAVSGKTDVGDKKVMGTLRNLGQSMLENIQVIESVFQHDLIQVSSLENLSNNILGSKKQVSAMAALKELRKISNLLSEM